jgi:hypothetical protein
MGSIESYLVPIPKSKNIKIFNVKNSIFYSKEKKEKIIMI